MIESTVAPAAPAALAGGLLDGVRQALAALPGGDDSAALREQILRDLRRLCGPDAIALCQGEAAAGCRLDAAWGLPAGLPAIWPPGAGLDLAGGDGILWPAAFGPAVAPLLETVGLRTAWCLRLPPGETEGGAVLLFFRAPAEDLAPDLFALAQLYVLQAGTLLSNAELRARLRARETQLRSARAASEISAALNSHLAEPDVLQMIADRAQDLLGSDGVAINLLESDGRSVRTLVVSGERFTPLLDRVHTAERSQAAHVVLTGEPVFWTFARDGAGEPTSAIRSAIIYPLIGPFGPIGSIGVLSASDELAFGPAERPLLELFARQAALAITNARMLERSRQEAAFQATFNQVVEALLVAHSDEEVQARLVEAAARLIPCESCFFAVYNGDLSEAAVRHAHARPGAPEMRGTWDPHADWPDLLPAILRGELIYWSSEDAADPPPSERTWRAQGAHSAVLVPVLYRGWLLGTLGFANILDMPNWLPLTPDLLRHLGAQVAAALNTARLYEETREHLAAVRRLTERLHALNNVSLQIQAALHPDEVYDQTFAGLRSLGLHAVVLRVDESGTTLHLVAHSFTERDSARIAALGTFGPPEPLSITAVPAFEEAIQGREVQLCEDMAPTLLLCFPNVPPERLQVLAEALGVARGVMAPLIARDRLLGLLVILGANLQPGDETALAPLATQAAIALDKAALYDAMVAARQFSDSLIDSMSEGLAVVDLESRHLLANRAFCDMVDFRPEDLEGRLPPYPYWPDEEHRAALDDLWKIFSGGYPPGWEIAVTLRRRDGSHFHAGLTPGEVHDERRRVTGFLVTVRDLTERERLESEAAEARAAREADRLKSELLSTVSHELRTPLAAIKGFTSTMLRYGDRLSKEEQREFLEDIEGASDRLAELVGNLLNMSRLEAALLSMEVEPLDLAPLVREEAAGFLPRFAGRKQQLLLNIPDHLPLVLADPRRMRQVFANLLDNAAKYTPSGGLIMVRAEPDEDDVVVVVADTGPGIPPDHLGMIFEPFHRVDSRLTRTVGGTGLGLAITRRILDAQGGRIEVQSTLGAGTTFAVRLPQIMKEQEPC